MKNSCFNAMKAVLTLLLLQLLGTAAFAQKTAGCDSIFLNDGKVILGRVKKVGASELSYEKCKTQSTTKYYIKTSKVTKIAYHDGTQKVIVVKDAPSVTGDNNWHIETTDGNEYIGEIVREDANAVVMKTASLGEITIKRDNIKKQDRVAANQVVDGDYWFRNPHDTRYFFSPNGYGLRKGEGYYQNSWVFYNQVSYGITDNFSLGAGTLPLFLFGGVPTPFWVTPKLSVPVVKDKLNIGVGAFLGTVIGDNDFNGGFGIVYSTATVGTREKNATLGLGYGYAGGDWATRPAIMLGGMSRVSKKIAFVSENYLLPVDGEVFGVLSAGCRFLLKTVAIDGALFYPYGSEFVSPIALPWVSLHVPFGKAVEKKAK